jgi:hypothetical protein
MTAADRGTPVDTPEKETLHAHLAKRFATFILILSLDGAFAQGDHGGHSAQDADFSQREQEVMPFDLGATLHTFEKSEQGGFERVTVKEAGDDRNIALIREHLRKEADLFARGDFSDPAYLHGTDMAGLSTLEDAAAAGRLSVIYANLPDGAELTFRAYDETVLAALHAWFDAQVNDHGDHATEGD